MNSVRWASSLILSACFVLSASCGSDDNGSGPGSTGGTKAGTGGAGTAGSGGAKAGASSTGGIGGGASGGSANDGGSKATGGSINDAGTTANGESGAGWYDGGAGNPPSFTCPTAKPSDGGSCSVFQPCTYDDGGCTCSNGTWSCYSASDCPASAPAAKEACDFNQMSCTYGDLRCSCSTTNGWSCETPCPATEPASDSSCTRTVDRLCRYDADGAAVRGGATAARTCACNDGKFTCFSAEDCPAEPPANASACKMNGLACSSYADRQCTCNVDGTWHCTTSCPAAPPAAATACLRTETQACAYAAGAPVTSGDNTLDTSCVCREEKFTCYTATDCPAAPPESNAECVELGLNCLYDNDVTRCRCHTSSSQWTCNSTPSPNGGADAGGAGGLGGTTGGAGGADGGSP